MGVFDRIARALDDAFLLTDELREGIHEARDALERGEPETALSLLAPVLGERPDQPQALALSGLAREALGDLSGARHDLEAARAAAPDEAEIAMALGGVRSAQGDLEAAADAYRAAALSLVRRGGVPFASAARALASVWMRLGRHDRAARELRKAAAAAPDAETLLDLGRALVADGEPAAAGRVLRRAMDLDPTPEGLREIGQALIDAGDADAAEAALRLAAASLPEDPAVRMSLAHALVRSGDPEGARDEAELAAGLRAEDPEPHRILAELAAERGDAGRALDHWIDAHRRAPEDPFTSRAALRAALRASDPRTADLAASLRGLSPEDPVLLAADAEIALAGDDASRAADLARRGVEEGGGPEAVAILARAHLALGEPFAAIEVLADVEGHDALVARAAEQVALAPGADPDLYATLERLQRWTAGRPTLLGLEREAERLVAERDRPLRLAVMGEFNAGKSTFINAWIGEEVAPMGVTPTTATLNLLTYGAERRVRVHMSDDSTREGEYADLRRILDEAAAEGPDRVRHVEILFPAEELLRVQVIDTPGLNAPIPAHQTLALRAVEEADAVVFLFRADQAGKDTERDALRRIAELRRKVVGVVNHADRVSAEGRTRVLDRLRVELGASFDGLACVSAREALEATKAGDGARLAASAFGEVRALVEERFFRPARRLKRQTTAIRATQAVATARAAALQLQASLERTRAEIASLRDGADANGGRVDEAVRRALGVFSDGLSDGARVAAAEVAGFLAPRRRFWETRGVAPEDLEFLSDLLEDQAVAVAATCRSDLEKTLAAIVAPLEEEGTGGAPPAPWREALAADLHGTVRGVVLFARGLRRGGRLERALLASGGEEKEDSEALVQRLRLVWEGVHEEAAAALAGVASRAVGRALARLDERLAGAGRALRAHHASVVLVLAAFSAALDGSGKVE